MIFRSIVNSAAMLACLLLLSSTATMADSSQFPQFKVIDPNVSFWKQVYAQYTTAQAIVHDNSDLNIVYDIIDLLPQDSPGARKINRKRMKRAKKRFQGILKRLASNPKTNNDNCQRVASLFGTQANAKTFYQARHRVRCQLGQKDRFLKGIKRSGAYIDQIRKIFKSYGLPEDLAYLPHVESSFNPEAYSKFGAAGMWQFTRSTGKRFMKVGYALDERRDPILASHAAAKLLKENYAALGSWPLAITAYNHGRTGMSRAKRKWGNYPTIFKSYVSRTFKFASRNFYSEFLAARQIASDYRTYFGSIALHQPTPYISVTLEGFARFEDLCTHFDVSADRLRRINPALRSPVIDGQKYVPRKYRLRLPADVLAPEQTLASIPASLYEKQQKPSRFYTVQHGDTAGKIARMHGVKLKNLILANNLNRRATIYPRQTLRLPIEGETLLAEKSPTVKRTPTASASTNNTAHDTANMPSEEPVTSPYPAPVLASVIPAPQTEPASKPAPSRTDDLPAPNDQVVAAEVSIERMFQDRGKTIGIIRVEVEETLGHYAEWAGVQTWQIRRLNGLSYGRTLHLHQKLKVPLHKTASHLFEQSRYEHHKRLQEDFFSAYRIGALAAYRIQRGDNYWTLCRDRFDIPMWLLTHFNPEVDLADLRIHQKLMIPTVEKIINDGNDFQPLMDVQAI